MEDFEKYLEELKEKTKQIDAIFKKFNDELEKRKELNARQENKDRAALLNPPKINKIKMNDFFGELIETMEKTKRN